MANKKNPVEAETAAVDARQEEIEALKEEIESLKAALKAAEGADNMVSSSDEDDLVEVFVPDDGLNSASVYISVNGENVMVKPGEVVMLKRRFAEVLKNSMKADQEARRRREEAKAKLLRR